MLPPVDIIYIDQELQRHAEELSEALEDQGADPGSDPRVLLQALKDLLDGLRQIGDKIPNTQFLSQDSSAEGIDIHKLGDYGIDMLGRLAAQADRLHLPQRARHIEELALPLACWIARRGAEIGHLGPVVNGAASVANSLKQPVELGRLYGLLTEVVKAVKPQISQDTTSTDPTRPWRLLLMNRAIVATRSNEPALMENAFDALVEHLPDEASGFFGEAMEQMNALNYPPRVRVVVKRYYDQWHGQHLLH